MQPNPIESGLLEMPKHGGAQRTPPRKHLRHCWIKTKLGTDIKGTKTSLHTKFHGPAPKVGVSRGPKPQNRRKNKSGRGRKLTRPDDYYGTHESPPKISGQSMQNFRRYDVLKFKK